MDYHLKPTHQNTSIRMTMINAEVSAELVSYEYMYGLFTMHNDSLSNAHTFPSVKHLISTLIGPSVKHYSNTFHASPTWVSNQLLNHDQLKQYVRFLKFKSQVLSVLHKPISALINN